MNIKEAMIEASKKIEYINAKILMQYVLKKDANYLIINSNSELDEKQVKIFSEYVKQIENGMPLQYITHKQEFMGENYYVDENVLIPQPDTEILVESAIKLIQKYKENKSNIKILDLCTGSGAIAISIKKYLNLLNIQSEIYASDISNEALRIAKLNANNILYEYQNEALTKSLIELVPDQKDYSENECFSVSKEKDLIKFIQSDLFNNINGKFDIIVSNPPYIKTGVIKNLPKDVQNEPNIALDGGDDGLKFYKAIKNKIGDYLNERGYLFLEIGYDQAKEVMNIFKNAECIKDYSNNDRVIIWKNEK